VVRSPLLALPPLLLLLLLLLHSGAALSAPPEPAGATLKTVVVGIKARRGVEEELTVALSDVVQSVYAQDKSRLVLGRQDLNQLLDFEAMRQSLGCDEASCLSEIAQALDADRLVTGSMDKLGTSYLLVLNEFDARRLEPLGRVERQLVVPEEQLVAEVRRGTMELMGQQPAPARAAAPRQEAAAKNPVSAAATPRKGNSRLWNGVSGGLKIGAGSLCSLAGLGCLGGSLVVGDAFSVILCASGGGLCCLGFGLAGWGAGNLLFPPDEEVDAQAASLPPPLPALAMPY
jgi:hypothetical protein